MATLPPPTLLDALDMAVEAMNRVILYGLSIRTTLDPALWDRIVEADYQINTIQDTLREERDLLAAARGNKPLT